MRPTSLLTVLISGFAIGASAGPPPSLEEIVALARGGAPGLALRLMDSFQEIADGDEWSLAERERLHILATRGDWQTVVERTDALSPGLAPSFMDWVSERRAEALIHLGLGQLAREELRSSIWLAGAPDEDSLRRWRVLLIRAYLLENDLDSALTALRRYLQDYGRTDPVLVALHAEALLRAGRHTDALDVLAPAQDEPMRSLAALAQMQIDPAAAPEVLEQAVRAGSARDSTPYSKRVAWALAAAAGSRVGNHAVSVAAMERALLATGPHNELPEILTVHPPMLWRAYVEWGRALGNAAQLIVGLDEDWMVEADNRMSADPAEARALLAALISYTNEPLATQSAAMEFARLMAAEQGGERLVAALFLHGGVFLSPQEIPIGIRYGLIDEVLRQGDIAMASQLIADVNAPPPDAATADWAMRRARVLVLAGRTGEARDALEEFLRTSSEYNTDRMLQVLFDLQNAEAHSDAYDLFGLILARDDIPMQGQREIYYWMADSARAMGEHAQAARLYLRSATLADPFAMDPWAQTARFQAAEALGRAGLRQDAVTILQSLLNATEDPNRRAALRQQIEQYQ